MMNKKKSISTLIGDLIYKSITKYDGGDLWYENQ